MNNYIAAAILILIASLAIFTIRKRFNSTWKGVLEDKKEYQELVNNTGNSTAGQHINTKLLLIFKTNEGQRIELSANKFFYDTAVVGTKYIKQKGQYNPVVVSDQLVMPEQSTDAL